MDAPDKFDIHARIFKFVIRVLTLTKSLPKNYENRVIVEQLMRSVTSMGANDQEANGASSRKDFCHCYTIVRKESLETYYWLSLIAELNASYKSRMAQLLQENNEIIKIVSTIVKNAKASIRN